MSVTDEELEFDEWDGQFEFVGNSYHNEDLKNNEYSQPNNSYDRDADLIFTPVTLENIENEFLNEMTQKRKQSFDKTAKSVSNVSKIFEYFSKIIHESCSTTGSDATAADERFSG